MTGQVDVSGKAPGPAGPGSGPDEPHQFGLTAAMAAVECRSETGTALTPATFDSKQMNWAMLGEFMLAVLVSQMDVFHRLLGTTDLNLREFGWALVPAIALLGLWELGKLIARRPAAHAAHSATNGSTR